MGIGKSSRFRLLFDCFDIRLGDLVLVEGVAEVISDDDLIVVEDDFADENFDDGFADLHVFNVAADHGIEEVLDYLRREVGIRSLLFLFNVEVELRNLCFKLFEPHLCLFGKESLFDCRDQILRGFQGCGALIFQTFENGV